MRGIERKCGDLRGHAGNLGGNMKNAQNQCDDARNEDENLGIAVEITSISSGNGKLKEWREIKIIENNCIYKNLVSHL